MKVTGKNDKIIITFDYNSRLVQLVKQLNGRKYLSHKKCWTLPLAGSMPSLKKLTGWGFDVDVDLVEAVMGDEREAKEVEALAVMSDIEFSTSLGLYPYQKVGSAFLTRIGSGLLGDCVGSGKTLMVLAVIQHTNAQRVLVFCPSSVKYQWQSEIEKFLGEKVVSQVIDGDKKKRIEQWRAPARVFIVNYELLLRDFNEMNREWDYVIADEATRISNPQAKQSKLIKKLKAKHRIAMTGTPISNRANEVWNVIDFCQPGVMGSYWSFLQKYCLKNQWGGIYGYQNMNELKQILKRYMIRRTKDEILPDLPEKTHIEIPFELCEQERELYKKIKEEILFEIDKTDINKLENPTTIQYTLCKLLRLQQLTDSMELLGENKISSKLTILKDLLPELTQNTKVLIYTKFSKFANIVERELEQYKPLKITGEVKERQEIIDKFNKSDENQVMIITDASAYGVNLQHKCSTVVFLDLPFSLGKKNQVTGRVDRIGQKNNVLIYYLIGRKTIDVHIKKIIQKKEELSNELLGDTQFTMRDIKQLLL